jgi:alkylhydroperoxidase family enzyme
LARRQVSEEELQAVDSFEESGLGEAEKAVLRLAEAFYFDPGGISEEVWAGLRESFDEAEIVEVAWSVASYIMFGRLIRAFEVPFGKAGGGGRPEVA